MKNGDLTIPLKELATIRTGQTFKTAPQPTEHGDLSVLLPRDLSDGKIVIPPIMINSGEVPALNNHLLKKDDVLIVNKGSRFGSFLYSNSPAFAIATSSFFVITPGPDLQASYLYWYLNQPPARHYLTQHAAASTTIPSFTKPVLANLPIPIVPVEEQEHLASVFREFQQERDLLSMLMKNREQLCDSYIWERIKKPA
ncbi:restriction endonuclease subunit S [Chitinophaga sp. HK235]|uniref:restriction endonuclease subunit S n=1 Tax=Chitinophaga sp. HK235 TaxID=2952571 RepID=UPI001BA4B70C|nr:restriction endonuclease subunit S [Chitinophaga sp. HK235]